MTSLCPKRKFLDMFSTVCWDFLFCFRNYFISLLTSEGMWHFANIKSNTCRISFKIEKHPKGRTNTLCFFFSAKIIFYIWNEVFKMFLCGGHKLRRHWMYFFVNLYGLQVVRLWKILWRKQRDRGSIRKIPCLSIMIN